MLEFPLLCRLCGSKTENGLYIYCDEGKRRQVETKIRLYLHFQVLPSDSLPKKICASCFEELEGMHRFAINTLKVQDHLLRLSKELPIAATDVCKSFMTNYTQEHVVVNDTIASLTSQEVTEMEVQVDPMVFLEDDQIEDSMQDDIIQEDTGLTEPVENDSSTLPRSPDNKVKEKDDIVPINCPQNHNYEPLESLEIKSETEIMIKQNERIHSQQNDLEKKVEEKNQGENEPVHTHENKEPQQSPLNEKTSEAVNSQNGNLTDSSNNIISTCQEGPASEPSGEKKCKKGTVATRSIKKVESRTIPTENIKCTTYTCPICKKVVMKRTLFKAHLEIHETDHKFACEICMRVFKKEINLIQHRKSHSGVTTFPCAHCNRVYPTKSTLRSHLVSHSDERPHICNICSKSFKRNQDLKFHLNQHNGLRPYHCPYCTKAFASSGNCFSHRRRAHMQEIERDRALRKSAETAN